MYSKRQLVFSFVYLVLFSLAIIIGSLHFWLGLLMLIVLSSLAYVTGTRAKLGGYYTIYSPLCMIIAFLVMSLFW